MSNARRIADRIVTATRYDSGFGTVDHTCDQCGTRERSFDTPTGWSAADGRHRCPSCQTGGNRLTCETCPTSVAYDSEADFQAKVVDKGWFPEGEITGGVLCPTCVRLWIDDDGYLRPEAPVRQGR